MFNDGLLPLVVVLLYGAIVSFVVTWVIDVRRNVRAIRSALDELLANGGRDER